MKQSFLKSVTILWLWAAPVAAADCSIVVSRATQADAEWNKVVKALVEKYQHAEVVTWSESLEETLPALRNQHPRHTCFVATPGEAGRQFVAA